MDTVPSEAAEAFSHFALHHTMCEMFLTSSGAESWVTLILVQAPAGMTHHSQHVVALVAWFNHLMRVLVQF